MSEEVAFGELPHRSVYRVRSSKETEPAVATVDGIQQIRQVQMIPDWIPWCTDMCGKGCNVGFGSLFWAGWPHWVLLEIDRGR